MPANTKQKQQKKQKPEGTKQQADQPDAAKLDVQVDKAQPKAPAPKPKQAPPKSPYIVHRSKDGLKLIESFRETEVCPSEAVLARTPDKDDRIECVYRSEDGELLAWCDRHVIKCINIDTREVVFEQPNESRSNRLLISPRSTRLVTFNTMSGGNNLHFWDLNEQKHLASMPFKNSSHWKPVFSMSEDICLQHLNGELVLYAGGKFDKPKQRMAHLKANDFSLSTASFEPIPTYQHLYEKRIKNKNHYIAVYSVGVKAQPSNVRIYKYPNMTDCITNKTFFKADSVKFSWSPSGTSLLLTCLADFDKTGKSYYGEQSLNFLNVKGDSYFVKLPKEGAIHNLEWYPSCDQEMFVCVYGLMPAKVSLFNDKCEVLHNFDEPGSFNETKFSPFGNMLAIFGFGNLAGQLCIWDFDKKKLVSAQKVPETTGIEWSADGRHLITCTTSPRLRVDNGFRIWHYTGVLLYEQIGYKDQGDQENFELYDLLWQPMPGKHKKPKIETRAPKQPNLLAQSKLSKYQGSASKYIPPSERNSATAARPSYMDSAEGVTAGGKVIVGLESLSISNKKKRPSNKSVNNKATNKATTQVTS